MHRTTMSAVLFMLFFAGMGGINVDDGRAQAAPLRVVQSPAFRQDICLGLLVDREIDGVGLRSVCTTPTLQAAGHIGVGARDNPLAFRSALDVRMFEVTGVCRSGGCWYSPHTDVLWEKRSESFETFGLYRHGDFSRNIRLQWDHDWGRWTYRYETPNAQRVLGGMVAYSVSENGAWVGAELHNRGVVRISTETGDIRRIAPGVHTYGRGFNPFFQIAVQNDGARMYFGGLHVLPVIVDINETCGDRVVAGMNQSFGWNVEACPSEQLSFTPTLPIYHSTHHPRFSPDGESLSLMVRSMVGIDYLYQRSFTGQPIQADGYIALGDSYTSGEGETDDSWYLPGTNTQANRCHVSLRSYPFLLVKTPLPVTSVACSGATTADILGSPRSQPAQQSAVTMRQPEVVTISIGGNDVDLVGKLASCAGPGTCLWARPDKRVLTAQEFSLLENRLVDVYAELQLAAPLTRFYVIGYPLAIDPTGRCDPMTRLLFNEEERRYLHEAQRLLNSVIASAAARASMTYVDISQSYRSHELCSGSATPAMNGLRLGNDSGPIASLPALRLIASESFHPTPQGHRLAAAFIDAAIGGQPIDDCTESACLPEQPPYDYWGDADANTLVYRLEPQQQTDGSVTVEAKGHFAADSEVKATLYSESLDLGARQTDDEGNLMVGLESPLLQDATHTLLLEGQNIVGQTVVAYATLRPAAVPADEQTPAQAQVIPGRDAPTPVTQPAGSTTAALPQGPRLASASATETETETAVLGQATGVSLKEQPAGDRPQESSGVSWLAPVFAAIGVGLAIMGLWLYFVRS